MSGATYFYGTIKLKLVLENNTHNKLKGALN